MAKKAYGLFVNRFEVVTRGSNTVASYLFKQHIDSLYADSATVPIAMTCYNRANPKYLIYSAGNITHSSQTGKQSGNVLSMSNILLDMPTHVDDWEAKIKAVYKADTPEFKALFSKGKKPFNSGSQQKRVDAVATLLATIGTDASLAAVKILVQAFYDTMLAAFGTKDVSKETTKTDSKATEKARIDMCNVMEGNYGLILDEFQDEPTLGAKYFDETYMGNKLQVIFNLKIKMLTTKKILKRTFANPLTQQLQIINNSNTTLHLFLCANKMSVIGTVFVTILPMSTSTHLLTDFGDPTTETFLKAYNADDKVKADITVKVL